MILVRVTVSSMFVFGGLARLGVIAIGGRRSIMLEVFSSGVIMPRVRRFRRGGRNGWTYAQKSGGERRLSNKKFGHGDESTQRCTAHEEGGLSALEKKVCAEKRANSLKGNLRPQALGGPCGGVVSREVA